MQTNTRVIFSFLSFTFIGMNCFAQPFIDPFNFSSQFCSTTYKDSLKTPNQTNDHILNIFIPKSFANGNVLLIRGGAEQLHSEYRGDTLVKNDLYAFSLPLGFQFLTKNKKWKMVFMVIPKIASDLKDDLSKDMQLGGTGIFTYVKSETLKFKFGIYYNREFFGNLIIPLAGVDWKAGEHLSFYGLLPNNYRIEYKWGEKLFTGIGFRTFQRSYRLSAAYNNDLVRVKESTVKLFVDYFIYKKILLFADVSHSIGLNLLQYRYDAPKTLSGTNPLYSKMNSSFLFSVGIALRLRNE